jgi:predicted lipoprotein with Yx(FWY)xxD motif
MAMAPAILFPALLCLIPAAAIAAPPPPTPAAVAVFKEKGAYVFRAGGESRPLYTSDRDQPGKSNCNGACATSWPPLAAEPGSAPVGDWSVIRRDDGAGQWAWRGKPIYTFANDGPEKATGDGGGGVWRLFPSVPAD